MKQKKLAIVIINWNSFDLTSDTLVSLSSTSYKNYDIIVVDNFSTDNSAAQLEKDFPSIILLRSDENKGFTGGNNLGFDYAINEGYEYVMMLNNDVAVEPDFLEPLVVKLDMDEKIGGVQPLIYFYHDRELIWNAGSRYNAIFGIPYILGYYRKDKGQLQRKKQKSIDWITGCAFMIRTEVLKKVGVLKQDFFIYYEDVDLSFRIKEAGYALAYEASSVVYHKTGMSHKSKEKLKEGYLNPKVHYLNARNRLFVLKEYTQKIAIPTVILYQIIYFFGISFYFIFRRRWQKLKAWNNGIKDGLFTTLEN
jgi:GT2 family glycosyltransferase